MSEVPLRCIPSTQTTSGVGINLFLVTSRGTRESGSSGEEDPNDIVPVPPQRAQRGFPVSHRRLRPLG